MFEVAFSRRMCCSRVDSVSTKPRLPSRVDGLAGEPARHLADVLLAAREQADIRPAELQPDADRLALADDDVGAHLARRFDQPQRDRFGDHRDQQRPRRVRRFGDRREVGDAAEDVGILDHDRAGLAVDAGDQPLGVGFGGQLGQRGIEHIAGEPRHGPGDVDVMRVQARRIRCLGPPRDPPRHADRFPAGGRAVVHRGIGDLAAVQPRDLGLELEQHLQRALRDLRLVGRVAGQKLAALDDVVDARRHMVAIGAAAEEERHLAGDEVLAGQRRQLPLDRQFGRMVGQALDAVLESRGFRHVAEQLVDRAGADHGQHLRSVGIAERQVTHQTGFLMMKRRRT